MIKSQIFIYMTLSYSEANQDMFVVNILKGINNGTFVDIGCFLFNTVNNTYLLETKYNWWGIAVDKDEQDFSSRKNCKFIRSDALLVDYEREFKENNFPKTIDYLSIDVDQFSLDCLKLIPTNQYDFKVITIEHNRYLVGDTMRTPQREYLLSLGYELICGDVKIDYPNWYGGEFEDWYVNPKYVDVNEFKHVKCDGLDHKDVIKRF